MAESPLVRSWRQLPRGRRRLLMGLGVAVAIGLSDMLAWQPLRSHARQLQEDVRRAEQALIEALVASGQAAEVASTFETYAPYLASAGSEDAALAMVLTEVETAVREADVVLLNLRPTDPTPSTERAAAVVVEAEAGPEQLVRLLDRLQRSPQLLRVSELLVRVVDGNLLRVTLVVQKLVLPAAVTAAPGTLPPDETG